MSAKAISFTPPPPPPPSLTPKEKRKRKKEKEKKHNLYNWPRSSMKFVYVS
tara:strand:+ start:329 stop:481 length:153 start_codon:yes stop_codon:yes gene_type:complete